jgi:hypothetical protein
LRRCRCNCSPITDVRRAHRETKHAMKRSTRCVPGVMPYSIDVQDPASTTSLPSVHDDASLAESTMKFASRRDPGCRERPSSWNRYMRERDCNEECRVPREWHCVAGQNGTARKSTGRRASSARELWAARGAESALWMPGRDHARLPSVRFRRIPTIERRIWAANRKRTRHEATERLLCTAGICP